jgi:ABC-2 type transport system permease protein
MISPKTINTAKIFIQFLHRDLYVYTRQLRDQVINYALIYPTLYIFCFAYLQTNIYFHGQTHTGAIVFAGTCLVPLLVMAFHITFDLLFDLEKNRHIDYQITVLKPHLVLVEQIIFASFFTFCVMIPFFPLARIFASSHINLSTISWPSLYLILYLGSLCVCSYHKLAATLLTVKKISMFWTRINHILLVLGGFWIPLHTISTFSPMLGLLLRLNPIVYLTEGLRQAIIGGNEFLPLSQCILALIALSVIFTALTCLSFKKRVDHI